MSIFLISCGEEYSYIIGYTTVFPQNDVDPPCDIVEVLYNTEKILSQPQLATRFGQSIDVKKILTFNLYLYPSWRALQTNIDDPIRANGKYFINLNSVHVRLLGSSIFDSALLHEIFAHRVPYYLFGFANADHVIEWEQFELEMTTQVHVGVSHCDGKLAIKKENQNIFIKIFNKFFRR